MAVVIRIVPIVQRGSAFHRQNERFSINFRHFEKFDVNERVACAAIVWQLRGDGGAAVSQPWRDGRRRTRAASADTFFDRLLCL